MTFTHVVTFTWTEGTDAEVVDGILSALRGFVEGASLEGLRSWDAGRDAGLAPTNADFAVAATFTDRDAYMAYRDHPEHRRILDEQIVPRVASRAAVQFES